MIVKLLGSIFIIIASLWFGMMIAIFHKKEVLAMKNLICALDYMECELQYRMFALPDLCRLTSGECSGVLRSVFAALANELEDQISPDVRCCMQSVLSHQKNIPPQTLSCLYYLGDSLGRFDLQGQLKGLDDVRAECREKLNRIMGNADVRIRSYQTLGLCAGAALVILLI